MLLGLDVGGTFTDAVLIDGNKVIAKDKKQTTHKDIAQGILAALATVAAACPDTNQIQRVALSTTLVTNAVTTNNLPDACLCVIPGPGVNCENSFPVLPAIFSGYTDHRGKLVAPTAYESSLRNVKKEGPVAISAKFSHRNAQSERELAQMLRQNGVNNVFCGHEMSGQLGFIRRTNSAYYTAATNSMFKKFLDQVRHGLAKHRITAPLYILKADGGTMPAAWIEQHTVEAYFTGPAASVMGIKALLNPGKNCISLDIGGTTTDIAFWENTLPLYGKRGAKINDYPTSVRAIHLRSLGVGGDSLVQRQGGQIQVGPQRLGPAMALGGEQPTLTDAFLLLGYDDFGDVAKAEQAMLMLSAEGETPTQTAEKTLAAATNKIIAAINEMIEEYSLQPVYRVEDVVNAKPFVPELIVGVGGAAGGILPQVAQALRLEYEIPQNAFVANAVGAAVARATLTADLRADTALGECMLPQAGQKIKIDRSFSVQEGEKLLSDWLDEQAQALQIDYAGSEVVWLEEFPVIRDSWRSGNIINLTMQLRPGVLCSVKGDDAQ